MKKRLLATLLALCLIVGLFPTMALAAEFFQADWTYPETGEAAISFTLGSGTQEEPFIIESAQDLANLAYLVNTAATYEDGSKTYASASYQLASNIDLQGAQWHPIGIGGSASEYEAHSFCGTFDGNYHTVSGLLISEDTYAGITNQNTQNNTDVKVLGLFGVLSDGAVIENLTVQTSAINLSDSENMCFAGMIAGAAVTSTGEISIKNCTVSSDCSVVGNSVDGAIAGIVGMIGGYSLSDQTSGTILVDGNKNYATIDGGEGKAGGITALVRWSDSNGVMTVSNNENYGSIDGNASGGIVGFVNVECGLEMNQGNQNFGSVSGGYCSGSLGGRVLSLKLTDYTVSPDSLLEDFGLVAGEIGETVIWQNDSADTTYYFSGLDGAMLRFSSVFQGI